MTNLSHKKPRRFRGECRYGSMTAPTSASTTLHQGAAIEEASGQMQNLTGAGTTFGGFLEESVTGDGTSDGTNIGQLRTSGEALLTCAHATTFSLADVGATVYATDGDTFTLVSTSAQAIGKVTEVPPEAVGAASAAVWVRFEAVPERSI